ncbi:MAG: RNA polymerase sigma factor [Candidatus Paceibacterota bacterium]|jgi:RNA polymerase sigma-70 factor (ECF subfamily)
MKITENTLESYRTKTDNELIVDCKNHDEQAFRELMDRYMKQIFNFTKQYSKTTEDAEDITQDTFLKVWKYIGRYTRDRSFKPWLYMIARNTALDFLKKKKSLSFSELDDIENDLFFTDTVVDNEPSPEELFANSVIIKELSKVMEDIHPDHRAILVMHYHEDMTFDEISTIIGKPMNTVKSWHRRALIKLQKKLMHQKS